MESEHPRCWILPLTAQSSDRLCNAGQLSITHLHWQLPGVRFAVGQTSSLVEAEHGDENADDEECDGDDEQGSAEGRYLGPAPTSMTPPPAYTGARCP